MRTPNAIDFWRGFALVEIMINHIPDNGFWRITHRQFSWSDAAELLVFLAGCTTAIAFARRPGKPVAPLVFERLRKIYVGHLAFSVMLVAMYVVAHDMLGDATIIVDNHGDLARTSWREFVIGLFTLTHHVRFFDVLPLYFVLTLWMPLMLMLDRISRVWLVAISLAVYVFAIITRINIPLWSGVGHWAFNPFAWQLIFTLGFFVGSRRTELSKTLAQWRFVAPLSWLIVGVSFVCMLKGVPTPDASARGALEDFLWSKTHVGPLRVVQFLALAHVANSLTWILPRLAPPIWSVLSLLGRNSLSVFCAAALLSAAGQIAHRAGWHGIAFDTAFTLGAVALMAALALAHQTLRAVATTRAPGAPLVGIKQSRA